MNIKNEAYLDSGCTSHYLSSTADCENKRMNQPTIAVNLPNGGDMKSTTIAHAFFLGVSDDDRDAQILTT